MADTEQYAHVLLFECPQCERPLAATCVSATRNLEGAEAKWFSPRCSCGWAADIAGVTALRHWVEPWNGKALIRSGEPGSCDEQPIESEK